MDSGAWSFNHPLPGPSVQGQAWRGGVAGGTQTVSFITVFPKCLVLTVAPSFIHPCIHLLDKLYVLGTGKEIGNSHLEGAETDR